MGANVLEETAISTFRIRQIGSSRFLRNVTSYQTALRYHKSPYLNLSSRSNGPSMYCCTSKINLLRCMISGSHRAVVEICTLQGYYAALSGSSVPTFRNNLSVRSSRVNKFKREASLLDFLTFEDGTDP
jgi:hypothetical protein